VTGRRVDFHWWQRGIGYCSKDFSGYGSQQARVRARTVGPKGGKARWNYSTVNSAQRFSADIIDTSERARANYRYVIGQHYCCRDIRAGSANLPLCANNSNVCVSGRLPARSVMICEREWHCDCHIACGVGDQRHEQGKPTIDACRMSIAMPCSLSFLVHFGLMRSGFSHCKTLAIGHRLITYFL
jgi:hypothetical protein